MPDVDVPGVGGAAASLNPALGGLFYRYGIVYPHRPPAYAAPALGPSSGGSGSNDAPWPEPLYLLDPLLAARHGGFVPPALVFQPGTETSPPPPPSRGPGTGVTQVIRVPDLRDTRLRRHTEQVAGIFNSLLRNVDIVQTDVDEWRLRNTTWVQGRAPGPTDDITVGVREGDLWLDKSGPAVYMCARQDEGVAMWVLLGAGVV